MILSYTNWATEVWMYVDWSAAWILYSIRNEIAIWGTTARIRDKLVNSESTLA